LIGHDFNDVVRLSRSESRLHLSRPFLSEANAMASMLVFVTAFGAGCLTGLVVCLRSRHRLRHGATRTRDVQAA
jgi:hypothetical protein